MATISGPVSDRSRDDMFFMTMALVMAGLNVIGFSLQFAMGRSSFGAPLLVHAHAIVFFGWIVIYVLQNLFAVSGRMALHRTLGWIAMGWMIAMIVLGVSVTVALVQRGAAPFFFTPAYFLVMNPMTLVVFSALTAAAVRLRRQTDWHRRLHYCGMAYLCAPAFGRLLPLPLVIPWAGWTVLAGVLLLPATGMIADLRRAGRVHPAWWWGVGAMLAGHAIITLVPASPLGVALYDRVVAGTPGAAVPGDAYPPFPPMP
jgi:hypothetical protein